MTTLKTWVSAYEALPGHLRGVKTLLGKSQRVDGVKFVTGCAVRRVGVSFCKGHALTCSCVGKLGNGFEADDGFHGSSRRYIGCVIVCDSFFKSRPINLVIELGQRDCSDAKNCRAFLNRHTAC